jgi:transitional endoplasmic reticulum ATPase
VNPSVTDETRQRYEEIERRFEQHEDEVEDAQISRTFQ